MKEYIIVASCVTGNGSLVFYNGQVEPENRFIKEHLQFLIDDGSIKEVKPECQDEE